MRRDFTAVAPPDTGAHRLPSLTAASAVGVRHAKLDVLCPATCAAQRSTNARTCRIKGATNPNTYAPTCILPVMAQIGNSALREDAPIQRA
jgi:hypothetical protein